MLIKTSELSGPALDWAVAKCEGWVWKTGLSSWYGNKPWLERYSEKGTSRRQIWELAFSSDWEQGGPIIEREGITIDKNPLEGWLAIKIHLVPWKQSLGPTPLIATMRCNVASKLGDEVEIPDELI